MTATVSVPLVPKQNPAISFATLCDEVKAAKRECGDINSAIDEVLRNHNVATAFTREVLTCAIFAEITKRCRHSMIPYSVENFTEWVRTLLPYGIPYMRAMEVARKQYHVQDFSERSKMLYRHVGKELNARSLSVQTKKRATTVNGC